MICAHGSQCGGCSLLHLTYDQQLASKRRAIAHHLGAAGGVTRQLDRRDLFLPVFPESTAPVAFRHKVSFVFGQAASGDGLVMGHYERWARRVIPVSECPVHASRGNRIAFALRDRLAAAGVAAAGSGPTGVLRHLIVRTTADDREAVAMLVVSRNDKALRRPVRALLGSADSPDGFFVNVNGDPGPFMIGTETIKIGGRAHVREEMGGVSFLVSPAAFFQTNPSAAAALQAHVVEPLLVARRVLDLYCGSGLFSLPLAASGVQVVGVEDNAQAVRDAEANARLNRIPAGKVRFMSARVEQAVNSLTSRQWDAVILDPPRQGCSDAVLASVFQEMRPPRVTYVSCNVAALGAELPGILACGYEVRDIRGVDMFPHTEHVELVVGLARLRAGPGQEGARPAQAG